MSIYVNFIYVDWSIAHLQNPFFRLGQDWNEFFCDPSRMVEGLLLQDGTRLFDLPHERRFLALPRVDWQVHLAAWAGQAAISGKWNEIFMKYS